MAYAGASAGALVAAAAAHDMLADLRRMADGLRRPIFPVDYVSLLRHGLRTPSLYRGGPLRALCSAAIRFIVMCSSAQFLDGGGYLARILATASSIERVAFEGSLTGRLIASSA